MKRAIRISILMVGVVGTFLGATVQQVPAADGGPIYVCPPRDRNCKVNLPPRNVVNLTLAETARSLR
jgi:hypothetical protein